MSRHRNDKPHRPSRLDRIERKCDRILSELLILRQQNSLQPDEMGVAIERLHRAARRLKAQSRRECEAATRMLHAQYPGNDD